MVASQEEKKHRVKPVMHEEYDVDMAEVLSQIRNLQVRVNVLEKKAWRLPAHLAEKL